MDSTLLIVIIIVAIILSVGFLLLIFSLVPAINELKFLLRDLQKTSAEARDLVNKLKEVSDKVNQDIEKVDSILDTSRETIETASKSLKFLNKNVLKHSAGILTLLPAARFGSSVVKKMKGGKK
jgi:predicted PurR-regulated permease PerM